MEGHDRVIMNAELQAVQAYVSVLHSHLSAAHCAANNNQTPLVMAGVDEGANAVYPILKLSFLISYLFHGIGTIARHFENALQLHIIPYRQ
jgi:hypothetical protein